MLLSVWVTQSEVCGGPLQFLKFNFCGGILTWSRRKEHKWPKFYVRSPRECRAEWDGLGCQSGAPDEAVKIQKSHQQIKQHDEGKQSVFCQVGYFVWMCICVVFKSTVEKKKKKSCTESLWNRRVGHIGTDGASKSHQMKWNCVFVLEVRLQRYSSSARELDHPHETVPLNY